MNVCDTKEIILRTGKLCHGEEIFPDLQAHSIKGQGNLKWWVGGPFLFSNQ